MGQAISLALELNSSWLIIDERPARRLAQALGIPIVGTLGILIGAKQKQLIKLVRPLVDGLLQHGFRLSASLYERVLAEAGELPSK